MTDVSISRLRIALVGAEGHEHRARAIARRATALLAELVERRPVAGLDAPLELDRLTVPVIEVDLDRTGDEAVARRIASALYDALASEA